MNAFIIILKAKDTSLIFLLNLKGYSSVKYFFFEHLPNIYTHPHTYIYIYTSGLGPLLAPLVNPRFLVVTLIR